MKVKCEKQTVQTSLKALLSIMLIICSFLLAQAQNTANRLHTIEGLVIDDNNEPLTGAYIVIKGTSKWVVTDWDGKFSIDIASFDEVLVVSMTGYIEQEILVKDGLFVKIILKEEVLFLDELVVTGYGNSVKKVALTGAISNINSEKLKKSAATHVSSALAGKIAGVNFRMTNGEPGSSTTISIRNFGEALYVIDGIQSTKESFNNINFNDIESISVLKDASAAIYGVQAGKGVVVVQTKSGRFNSKNSVEIHSYYGLQSWFRYPKPADVLTYVSSHIQSDAITMKANPSYTPKFTVDDLEKYKNGTLTGFDWYNFVVQQNVPQYYVGANVTGGSDKASYYLSFSGLDQTSILRNYGGFTRYNIQSNVEVQVNKRFKVGLRFNGRYEHVYHPAVPGDDTWAALFAIWRNPPTNRPFANDNPDYPAITSNTMSTNFAILNYEKSGYYDQNTRVGQINLTLDYQLADGLKLKGTFGYYFDQLWLECQEYVYNLYKYDNVNDKYDIAYTLDNPFRLREVGYKQHLNAQGQIIYDKKFGKHNLHILGAAELYFQNSPGFHTWSRPLSNVLTNIDFETLEKYVDYGKREVARAGFIGRINYDYDNKYYVEIAGRYDGSWKFRSDMRWGLFPSISGAWRLSNEEFWKESPIASWFNSLKIRASYGILGDDNVIDPFQYLAGYSYGSGGATLDSRFITGAVTRGIPTTTISWIKIKLFDVGLDYGFLRNRLNGSIDYFRRLGDGIKGQRYDVLIPSETGIDLPFENLISDLHTGIDGNIFWYDKIKDFSYSLGLTFTFSRYYTWEQYKPMFGNSWDEYRTTQWHRYGNITWGYQSDGQFSSWDEIYNYETDIDGKGNSTIRPGDIKYKDLNGDKIINEHDMRPIGYSEGIPPDLNFGLNISLNYKNFDLSCDFTGGALGTYHINYEVRNPFWDGGNTAQFILDNQWHLKDITDADSKLIPASFPTAIAGNSNHSNYWVSDFWYRNVVYIKLKNLEFGYNFATRAMANIGMDSLRLYLFSQNLFSIDNMGLYEIDPEIASSSALAYPTTRIIGAGLKFKF
ncbi:MAG: TonB-dependent receptor [Bacteroidales bacterium]|mgnify:CR=1 FL=1|jgi:TonB-linked SusC/RagA family outer membrane protein